MPQKFYDPEEQITDKTPCGALRDDLKYCLQNTDCFKKVLCNYLTYIQTFNYENKIILYCRKRNP